MSHRYWEPATIEETVQGQGRRPITDPPCRTALAEIEKLDFQISGEQVVVWMPCAAWSPHRTFYGSTSGGKTNTRLLPVSLI